MSTMTTLAAASWAAAFATLVAGSAAALNSSEQKCIDGYNNKLRLVSQQAGKSARACIKNAGKGTEANPDNCIVSNTDNKVAGKEQKVADLFPATCTGFEPIQQGAAVGNAAHREAITDLAHAIFGNPVTSSTVISPSKETAKCQDKAIQRAGQLFTEKIKAFRKCKKDGMKAATINDSIELETECMHTPPFGIPDPAGKIAKKVQKLIDDVTANCGAPVTIPSAFAGTCFGAANEAALAACIETRVECQVCLAINGADGTGRDCDAFDDGLFNASCGIQQHKCVLDTAPTTDSQIQIHIAALPVPLTFGISGALDIGAGGMQATCDIQFLNPVNIPSIGFVCISPASGCAVGDRHCGPGAGPPLGIDVQSDGLAGACTSNAQCATIAAGACADEVLSSACTGYCSGSGPSEVCTNDVDCLGDDTCTGAGTPSPCCTGPGTGTCGAANGACNGVESMAPAQRDVCQISCIDNAAHGASDPGDLQCNLGSDLVIETGAPCNGTDVLIDVGTTCIPLSTQRATSLVADANYAPGTMVPAPPNVNDHTGSPLACATVDTSTVTGLVGVGAVNFFGSALGDLAVGLKATCQ